MNNLTLGNLIVDADYRRAHAVRRSAGRMAVGTLLASTTAGVALLVVPGVPFTAVLILGVVSLSGLLIIESVLAVKMLRLRRRAERRFQRAVRADIWNRYQVDVPESAVPVAARAPRTTMATADGAPLPVILEFVSTLQVIAIDGLGAGVPSRWWAAA